MNGGWGVDLVYIFRIRCSDMQQEGLRNYILWSMMHSSMRRGDRGNDDLSSGGIE